MTEEEAELKEIREQPAMERGDEVPDFIFFDGDRPAKSFRQAIDVREIQTEAIRFTSAILFHSRTRKAGQVRLLAARHLVTGSPTIAQICRRTGVSKRQVYRAIAFVRMYCDH